MTQGQVKKSAPQQPRRTVWAVRSYRSGETTQILALANELVERFGWSLQIKSLDYRPAGLYNLMQTRGLLGLRPGSRHALQPPWPDLVISAGLRNEPPCRWIKARSGGKSRLVFLGRSWVSPEKLELLIATPQYRVSPHPHVLQNQLTLHGVSSRKLVEARCAWEPTFAGFPAPRAGVLLGGSAGPYVLGDRAVERLAAGLESMPIRSVLISTSSRTPAGVGEMLQQALSKPAYLYRWQAADEQNPYPGILAHADELVVSGDSVAMISEAVGTGKPVKILDLGSGDWSMGSREGGAATREDLNAGARLYRFLMRHGHRRWTRDVTLVHRELVASGHAAWLGDAPPAAGHRAAPSDMDAAIERILQLWPAQDSAARIASTESSTKRPSTTR